MSLTYYNLFNGYSLTRGLEELRPDYIIFDDGLNGLLVEEGYFSSTAGFALYDLPKREFRNFLAERGASVLSFSDPWHGYFEIYAIEWD
jgi:hypothetical protein